MVTSLNLWMATVNSVSISNYISNNFDSLLYKEKCVYLKYWENHVWIFSQVFKVQVEIALTHISGCHFYFATGPWMR